MAGQERRAAAAISEKACLKRLAAADVRLMCSTQVIVGVASLVKELVENALDAAATSVEVRLRDHGVRTVEVVDNGHGVAEADLDTICTARSTSKLAHFADLGHVNTFGFRGEALHSLCAVSKVDIVTRNASSETGWRLEFDSGGRLASKRPFPRPTGTTVIASDLFAGLPVRRRELERTAKKQLASSLAVLKAHALVARPGVRLTCSNASGPAGTRLSRLLDITASSSLRGNVASVFSSQEARSLVDLPPCGQVDPGLADELSLPASLLARQHDLTVTGLVSGLASNSLRACGDRQFVFVDGRPANLPRLQRVVNDFFRPLTSRHLYPAFFLQIDLSRCRDLVDVNVSPDKRDLFLACESLLVAIVRTSLATMLPSDQRNLAVVEPEQPPPVKRRSCATDTHEPKDQATVDSSDSGMRKKTRTKRRQTSSSSAWSRSLMAGKDVSVVVDGICLAAMRRRCCSVETSKTSPQANKAGRVSLVETVACFSKSDFSRLAVVGQFNSSFVVARLARSSSACPSPVLFVVDQHAADERWNFELLEKTALERDGVQVQALIAPVRLDLAADARLCLRQNMDVAERSGFRLKDGDGAGLWLTAVPSVVGRAGQSCLFGQGDLAELVYHLMAASSSDDTVVGGGFNASTKPSRLRRVHASRACRRAIMAGQALSEPAMRKLLQQLAQADHPWNCPHGRPTIRHLLNLESTFDQPT